MTEDNSKISRRMFVITGAAAAAGVALRLHRIRPVEAKDVAPKQVKLVQFSDSGQREDLITVPMIVKSDAEWKEQLPPDTFIVTRHAGSLTQASQLGSEQHPEDGRTASGSGAPRRTNTQRGPLLGLRQASVPHAPALPPPLRGTCTSRLLRAAARATACARGAMTHR